MKKNALTLIAAAALTAFALTGCANAAAYDGARPVAPQTGESTSAATPTPTPAAPVAAPAGDTTAGVAGSADPNSGYITEDAAKAAALEHAGLTEADLDGIRVRLDYDDGIALYDVEFLRRTDAGVEEYDYEIGATDGKILGYDYDAEGARDGQWTGSAATGTAVDAEQAKQIALTHAGVAEADVYGLEMEREHDHGRTTYEFSWKVGFTEYDYEIDADTGEIVSFSQEQDD